MSMFATEEEFEQWFVDRYGHHTRDWHEDRGLPYPGDAPADAPSGNAASDRRRAAVQALIDRGATEGEREAARAAMARLDQADEDELAARLEQDTRDEDEFEDAYMHGAA